MGNKSAISFASLNNQGQVTSSPFWMKPKTKSSTFKQVIKIIWKWFKLALFAFLMLMGLWGCFQTMWDSNIMTSTEIGSGLEFAFPYGTTGDWRYDLQGNPNTQYHTMWNWTMDYGPFYAFFVWPACWLVFNLMYVTNNWWGGLNALLSIFILLLIIRILSLSLTMRSSLQNERMTEISGKMSEINAKYKDLKDTASKQKKQQEIMELYSKYNVKPFAAFEQMFITLPIFLIVYRVVTIVRPMKASVLFGVWNFAFVPLTEIFNNFTDMGWTYIFFLALVIPAQFLSMKLPQRWAKQRNRSATTISEKGSKQMKKTRMTQNIFTIVMSIIVAFSATGVGVYWFLNALFSIAQAYIIHLVILHNRKKNNSIDSRLRRLGFE